MLDKIKDRIKENTDNNQHGLNLFVIAHEFLGNDRLADMAYHINELHELEGSLTNELAIMRNRLFIAIKKIGLETHDESFKEILELL